MKTKATAIATVLTPDFSFNNSKTLVEVYKNLKGREASNLQIKTAFGELRGMVVDGTDVYLWKKELATHSDVKTQFEDLHVFESFVIDAYERLIPADKDLTEGKLLEYSVIKNMMKR